MQSLRGLAGPLLATLGSAIFRYKTYLVSAVTSCSKVGYLFAESVLSIGIYGALLVYKGKTGLVNLTVDKKYLAKIVLYVETPFIIGSLFLLKAFEHSIVVANATFSCSPFIDLIKEKLIDKKFKYSELARSNNENFLNELEINVYRPQVNIVKEDGFILLYAVSICLFYLDGINKNKTDISNNEEMNSTICFASLAAVSMFISRYYFKKIIQDSDPDVFAYVETVCSLPIAVVMYTTAFITNEVNLSDEIKNDFDNLLPIVSLTFLQVVVTAAFTYAMKLLKHPSDFGIINALSGNIVALFLEKGLDIEKYNFYSGSGVLLTITSCFGMIANARKKTNEEFLDVLLKQVKYFNDLNIYHYDNKKKIQLALKEEYDRSNLYKDLINDPSFNINTVEYSELLLIILSKILCIDFEVWDQNKSLKLVVTNKNSESVANIKINIMYQEKNSHFNNKIIFISDNDKINISNIDTEMKELELVGEEALY